MVSYEDSKKHRNTLVLISNGDVVATFGNLKKVLTHLKDEEDVPSYWTLTRQQFPLKFGHFEVHKVRHY